MFDPVSAQTLVVYNQSPALAGRNESVWDNEEILDSNYKGGDITINKRMNNGWSMMAGASFGKSIGEVVGGDLNNPNSKEFRRGLLGNDVPWSYRLSGVYDLPHNIASLSGTMQDDKGVPELTTVLIGAGTVPGGLTQVTQSVVVQPRGEERLPNVFSLDISLRKTIRVGNQSLEPRLDFYNLTNEATVTNWLTQLGSTYHRASTIQAGRMIKIGFNFNLSLQENQESLFEKNFLISYTPVYESHSPMRRRGYAVGWHNARCGAEAGCCASDVAISGELKQWHKVTLTLTGPQADESSTAPNPFTDYRMTVTFAHESGTPTYRVPGYFAGDGDAANSSATSGNKWRAHVAPDKAGRWTYRVSFVSGKAVALAAASEGQRLAPLDGRSGTFQVTASDKKSS